MIRWLAILLILVASGAEARTVLTSDAALFVRTNGDDDNTGLTNDAFGAFATLQGAANYIQQNYDCGAHRITVKVGAGTYAAGVKMFSPFVGGDPASPYGCVLFSGDTATPDNVTLSGSGILFTASFGGKYGIEGFKLTTTAGDLLYASADGGGIWLNGPLDFGATPNSAAHMHANQGAWIIGSTPYAITGGAQQHFYSSAGGHIEVISSAVTIANGVVINYFAYGHGNGTVYTSGNTYSRTTIGMSCYSDDNGLVYTNGTALPGFGIYGAGCK